jgi:hypothetical protein
LKNATKGIAGHMIVSRTTATGTTVIFTIAIHTIAIHTTADVIMEVFFGRSGSATHAMIHVTNNVPSPVTKNASTNAMKNATTFANEWKKRR